MTNSISWPKAVAYMLEEDEQEFEILLSSLSSWDIIYSPVVYVMPDGMDDWEILLMNAFYRDTKIQIGEPLPSWITDKELSEFIEAIETRTLGIVRKVTVAFLELRCEKTIERLNLAIATSSPLSGKVHMELV